MTDILEELDSYIEVNRKQDPMTAEKCQRARDEIAALRGQQPWRFRMIVRNDALEKAARECVEIATSEEELKDATEALHFAAFRIRALKDKTNG